MKTRPHVDAETLAAYLEGELARPELEEVAATLSQGGEERQQLEQLRHIRMALSSPVSEVEGIDVTGRVRRALQKPAPSRTRRSRWLLPSSALVLAAGIVLVVGREPLTGSAPEFRAQSDARVGEAQRWAGIQIYRVAEGTKPKRLGERLAREDGLVFSYTNIGAKPFEYVMIFAVDARGDVYWYYPDYEQAGQNPESVSIEKGRVEKALSEVIRHDFAVGQLSVYALFSRRALRVLEIEAWLRNRPAKGAPVAPFPDTTLQVIETVVE